ncbi:hypothetical protein BpHYR1_034809 [Brachionus plicatilis]|uniref:Uncharacterized protein n=1 Tax=Brachionus plicatilis TaxID=10195 RepID=A0A3M7QDY2_BRAPC|nr:hypothetical protein BpHYR1_034809 [Brachionus plicatilis]
MLKFFFINYAGLKPRKNPAKEDDPQLGAGNCGVGNDNGAENSHPVVNGAAGNCGVGNDNGAENSHPVVNGAAGNCGVGNDNGAENSHPVVNGAAGN